MTIVTVDASCAISWLFAEQRTAAADRLLLDAGHDRVAPDIFAWEMGNFIALRGRAGRAKPAEILDQLARLSIRTSPPRDDGAVSTLIPSAVKHDLSLFDAAYLLHALGHGGALASRDARLLNAARQAGVDVFDLRD